MGKVINRIPESYWLETSIATDNSSNWQMHKLGQALSPLKVVKKGNRNLHLLSAEGLVYTGTEGNFQIQSQEAPLFSFGGRRLLQFNQELPDLNQGIFINLYNNVWGTNFPTWYEGDLDCQGTFTWQLNSLIKE